MAKVIKWADLVEAKKIPAKRRAANAAAVKEMLIESANQTLRAPRKPSSTSIQGAKRATLRP